MKAPTKTPIALLVFAFAGVFVFAAPLFGLALAMDWAQFFNLISNQVVLSAFGLSVLTSFLALVVALLIGVPLAWVLANVSFPGRSVVRALVTLPMVLPPVVGGTALLFTFGRRGLFGPALETLGVVLPFSVAGVVLANAFVATPFLVMSVYGALAASSNKLEEAAFTLGASPLQTFRLVTLPVIRPALMAGSVLAWARAFGEFGATITFAGNLPQKTQTLPLSVYIALESNRDAAVAISLLMVAVSFAVLIGMRKHWWPKNVE